MLTRIRALVFHHHGVGRQLCGFCACVIVTCRMRPVICLVPLYYSEVTGGTSFARRQTRFVRVLADTVTRLTSGCLLDSGLVVWCRRPCPSRGTRLARGIADGRARGLRPFSGSANTMQQTHVFFLLSSLGCCSNFTKAAWGTSRTICVLRRGSFGSRPLSRGTSPMVLADILFLLNKSVLWCFRAESAVATLLAYSVLYRGPRRLRPLTSLAYGVVNADISFLFHISIRWAYRAEST